MHSHSTKGGALLGLEKGADDIPTKINKLSWGPQMCSPNAKDEEKGMADTIYQTQFIFSLDVATLHFPDLTALKDPYN